MLGRMGTGLGTLGLASVLSDELAAAPGANSLVSPLAVKSPHFAPRAKRIIHLYMNGGPSQVDTFDHKPKLIEGHGKLPEHLTGRSKRNEIVHIVNAQHLDIVGEIVQVEVMEAFKHSLLARLTPPEQERLSARRVTDLDTSLRVINDGS